VRKLDTCLQLLEDALELGQETVSPYLAASIEAQGLATDIRAGIPVSKALDMVFEEQGRHMDNPVDKPVLDSAGHPRSQAGRRSMHAPMREHQLNEAAARQLTMRIKTEIRQVCVLLLEAHDRYAWKALGYASWELYVRQEFGYSRSRSYELLNQGRIVKVVQDASGSVAIPYISAYAAGQIKPHIDEVVDEIRRKVSKVGQGQRPDVVGSVIQATRLRLRRSHEEAEKREGSNHLPMRSKISITPNELLAVLGHLAELSSADEIALGKANPDSAQIDLLNKTIDWLTRLRSLWQRNAHSGTKSDQVLSRQAS
jgi:hypothetical protein